MTVLLHDFVASGKKQMSSELVKLSLEVGHENSDSTSHPARDGTISWVHGVRFAQGPPGAAATEALCSEPRFNAFHPTLFRASRHCSYHFTLWSKCWSMECLDLWRSEYGCALRGAKGDSGRSTSCITPFARTLLQVHR